LYLGDRNVDRAELNEGRELGRVAEGFVEPTEIGERSGTIAEATDIISE
jgi:non-canonical (house-cleaning) NTP pyrophosphatase